MNIDDKEKDAPVDAQTSDSGKVVSDNTDYIEAINNLKQNSVPKADYDKLAAEKKKLVQALAAGQIPDAEKKEQQESVEDLRKEIFSGDLNNMEYVQKTLQLRQTLIERGEPDPFLPFGHQISPTEEDVKSANKLAKVFEECLEYAEGDPAVFTNELSRRTMDIKIR